MTEGPVAHLVERCIRIAEVRSSSLLGSTKDTNHPACAGFCAFVEAAAMFRQQTKPRGGVEKILSDGEELFVTTKNFNHPLQLLTHHPRFLLR